LFIEPVTHSQMRLTRLKSRTQLMTFTAVLCVYSCFTSLCGCCSGCYGNLGCYVCVTASILVISRAEPQWQSVVSDSWDYKRTSDVQMSVSSGSTRRDDYLLYSLVTSLSPYITICHTHTHTDRQTNIALDSR